MARIRTNKNICLYCFGDLDTDRVCMNCHHKADDSPSPPHHLPQRSVIGPQNRYLIGKALGEGREVNFIAFADGRNNVGKTVVFAERRFAGLLQHP